MTYLLPQCFFVTAVLFVLSHQQNAEIEVGARGICSRAWLWYRGIGVNDYKPSIAFNPSEISVEPKNPVVPGCINLVAKNVTVIRRIRHLTAEFEMRIGGAPNPKNPTLKCVNPKSEQDNKCGCKGFSEDSCTICDFCHKMKKHLTDFTVSESKKQLRINNRRGNRGNQCKCDVIEPGIYDLEAKMCTPSAEEISESVPDDIKDYVEQGQPLSIFTTIYLYDFDMRPLSHLTLSTAGKKVLEQRKNRNTIGCYLIGTDIHFNKLELNWDSSPARTLN